MNNKIVTLIFLSLFCSLSFAQIQIDGVFFDWDTKMQIDVDPFAELTFDNGDPDTPDPANPSYFADLDIEDVFATDDADFVYLRIKMNSISNVLNIEEDTSYHGGAAIAAYISVDPGEGDTTGLTWGWWGNGYDFLIQAYPADSSAELNTYFNQYVFEHSQNGNAWDFVPADTLIGVSVAWNFSNNDVEMAIPKSLLLNPKNLSDFEVPDSIAIMIYAGENSSPWRADYAALPGIQGYKLALTEPSAISIDGTFFDWDSNTQLDTAPNTEELTFDSGDPDTPDPSNPSYFADLDIEDIFATTNDDEVFFRIKMNSIANVMNIPEDTSYHGGAAIALYISVDPGEGDTTGLTWGWWGSGYDYLIQAYPADSAFKVNTGFEQGIFEHSQNGNAWDFALYNETRGAKVAWNFSNNEVEISVPKSILKNPSNLDVEVDDIAIMIYAGENSSPWRADYASEAGVAGYILNLDGVTDISDELKSTSLPSKYSLAQNYPNPFNPVTKISFSLPKEENVKLSIYNILGQLITTLVDDHLSAGNYTKSFNGENLTSGIYFYTLEVGQEFISRKMILMK